MEIIPQLNDFILPQNLKCTLNLSLIATSSLLHLNLISNGMFSLHISM